MKKVPLFIIIFLMSAFLYAQEEQVKVVFHNFPWGTSMRNFKARMGEPVHTEEVNGLQSLVYDNVRVSEFSAFMIAYFSNNGLEGGTYYFKTTNPADLVRCYTELQKELLERYGPTLLYEVLLREMRPYESSWNLPSGYILLKINTRWWNEPVSLWFSSPELTRRLRGADNLAEKRENRSSNN